MDIRNKLTVLEERYTNLIETKEKRQQELQQIVAKGNNEVKEMDVELNRMQGEYRLLREMAVDEGILDENGNVIDQKEDKGKEEI